MQRMSRMAAYLLSSLALLGCPGHAAEGPAIHEAVIAWDVQAVRKILDRSPSAINFKDSEGRTPLRYLAELEKLTLGAPSHTFSGRLDKPKDTPVLEIAKLLIARGANINARDSKDSSALNWAITTRKPELALLLIGKGADVRSPIKDKSEDLEGATPLHFAAGFGYLDIVRQITSRGGSVNARAANGLTPLHTAALGGHPMVVKFLLDHGAKIDVKDSSGKTPLASALSFNDAAHKEVAGLLRAAKPK